MDYSSPFHPLQGQMGQTSHWIYAPSKVAMYCVVAPKIKTVRDEVTSTEGNATKRTLWTEIERVQRIANRTVRTFAATSVMCAHLQTQSKKNDIYLSLTATFHEQQR